MSLRLIAVLALVAAAAATVLALDPAAAPPEAHAQRPTPDPARALALYGRRYVVPIPQGFSAASGELAIANVGWNEASVALLAVGPATAAICPAPFQPSQILDHRCGVRVPSSGELRVPYSTRGATHLLVYSLAGDSAAACAALDDVAAGRGDLAAWERGVWEPGESIVPTLRLTTAGGDGALVSGQAAYVDLVPELAPRFRGRGMSFPALAEGETHVWTVNPGAECVTVGGIHDPLHDDACPTPGRFALGIAPHSAVELPTAAGGGGASLPQAGGLAGLAEHGGRTGYTYAPAVSAADVRQVYAPFAAGLLDGLTSEVWVTNEAPTATTKVDIVMLTPSGALHKLYTDPTPLCAGGTRAYDVTGLAGELPPADRAGQASTLSLRVTSTNLDLPEAPPISAAVVLHASGHGAAYPADSGGNPLLTLAAGRDAPIGGSPVVVVPDVTLNAGSPPLTTLLAIQSTRGLNASRLYIDFFDEAGQLVLDDAYFVARGDGGMIIDLAQGMGQVGGGTRLRLPNGFRGTAMIRPESPRDNLSVLRFDRAGAARPDQPVQIGAGFAMSEGVLAVRPVDPSLPTATPSSTPLPDRPTPTPTGTGCACTAVFLPWASNP